MTAARTSSSGSLAYARRMSIASVFPFWIIDPRNIAAILRFLLVVSARIEVSSWSEPAWV